MKEFDPRFLEGIDLSCYEVSCKTVHPHVMAFINNYDVDTLHALVSSTQEQVATCFSQDVIEMLKVDYGKEVRGRWQIHIEADELRDFLNMAMQRVFAMEEYVRAHINDSDPPK